jgi:hypothetical protein
MTMRTRNHATDPRHLAPSVDPRWLEAFVTERNLLGVQPARLGDDLVTIESHVREAGVGAQDIFGDPATYARELPTGSDREPGLRRADLLHIGLGLAGMLLAARGIGDLLDEGVVAVTGGDLASTGLLALAVGLLLAAPSATLRLLVRHWWVTVAVPVLLVAAFVGVRLAWREQFFTLPAWFVTVVGLVALVASSVLAYTSYRDGAVTAPGEPVAQGARRRRWTFTLLYPVLLIALVLMGWVPTLFA